jgi:hypothetical protein
MKVCIPCIIRGFPLLTLIHPLIGQFESDHFHGTGTLKHASGASYRGGWKNHKRSGHGKYVYLFEEYEGLN